MPGSRARQVADADRERRARRDAFDAAAEAYDAIRPGYPDPVFEAIAARVPPPADVLEVGPGTGQATVPLVARGYRVAAVEPGARLAAVLRAKLPPSSLALHVGRLEDWPMQRGSFDLAVAFSSFHWIAPRVGYRLLAEALRADGWLALAWSEPAATEASAAFEAAVDPVYARLAPALRQPPRGDGGWRAGEGSGRGAEIEASRRFAAVERYRVPWQRRLATRDYLRLLTTYSNHLALPPEQRAQLHAAIGQVIDARFGGTVIESRATILYLAHRRATPAGG